ncbi:MAG: archease [Candidatus Omnitrophota bacterium]
MAEKFYEILEHTADIRIRVRAKSLKDLFSQTARAVFDIIAERKPGLSPEKIELTVTQKGGNREELFINWLNELLSLSSADGLIFSDFKIKSLDDKFLEATVSGEKSGNYNINKEVKAATYHQFQIIENKAGWKAEVILDV